MTSMSDGGRKYERREAGRTMVGEYGKGYEVNDGGKKRWVEGGMVKVTID